MTAKPKPNPAASERLFLCLREFIESRRTIPHEYGKNDCCLFVADWLKLKTGKDPAKGLRRYRSERGAQRIIAAHGGTLLALLTERLGAPDRPLTVRRGDVIYGDGGEGAACGICVGHAVAFVGETGIILRPLKCIEAVWHG